MSNDTNTSSSVWVETESLLSWKSNMNTLNQTAVTTIEEIASEMKSLPDSWKGLSASGFENTMDSTLKTIVSCHEEMGNVESFLTFVVDTMDKQ